MKINVKSVARGNRTIETREIHKDFSRGVTVRDFLLFMVEHTLKEYKERKEQTELIKVLTEDEIRDKAKEGRIDFDTNNGEKVPDEETAKINALQSFEDGVTVLFIGEHRTESLDEVITVKDDTEITFIKLTMMAGRMW